MITLCLPEGNNYGWGVCGSNLIREMSLIKRDACEILNYQRKTVVRGRPIDKSNSVINCLAGPDFSPFVPEVTGTRNVAYGFIEDIDVARRYRDSASRWDHIVCGSHWMEQQLRGLGLTNVSTAVQGVDKKRFSEDQRHHDENEFRIFIGGKLEFRKGQDIAIAAARELMKKHADVSVVLAINNPWRASLETIRSSSLIGLPADLSGPTKSWVGDLMSMNGISRWEYFEGPNQEIPQLYGKCNVGLFLSRCEAGQNLMLSEAMMTAMPAIVAHFTGQKDATDYESSLCITEGKQIENGWYEPSLRSAIDLLEWAYGNRKELAEIGRSGCRYAKRFSWEKTARALLHAATVN